MIRLLCEDNFLEYAGHGYFQCGRHVRCPKKENNKVLGFDCITYIDNLPDGYKLPVQEVESVQKSTQNDDVIKIDTVVPKRVQDIFIECRSSKDRQTILENHN